MTRVGFSLSPETSQLFVLAAFVLLILLDVVGSGDATNNNTPREFLRWAMARYPIVRWFAPFAVGVLTGHFFHPLSEPLVPIGGLATVVALVLSWPVASLLVRALRADGRLLLALGALVGTLVWPVGL